MSSGTYLRGDPDFLDRMESKAEPLSEEKVRDVSTLYQQQKTKAQANPVFTENLARFLKEGVLDYIRRYTDNYEVEYEVFLSLWVSLNIEHENVITETFI